MLSEETKQRLTTIAVKQASYSPSAATKAKLGDKTLIMLVSATCMGKSTIMRELESEIPTVGTITTRPKRVDDALYRYTFYDHTNEGLAPLLNDIEAGNLVQYVINPYSGYIYGSHSEDYPNIINIGDYFSSAVECFRTYGFGRIIVITVVTEPAMWLERFDQRFPANHPERQARLTEARTSLEWSLGEPSMVWVINRNGESQSAANSVEMAVRNELIKNQAEAKVLAKSCLQLIKELSNV